MAMNHLGYQGRLVADAEFGDTSSGVRYANFRLAWSEKYKEQETKCFLDCKAFRGTAQFIEKYLSKKGQEMLVEGKLTTDEWEKDGQKRSKIVCLVNNVHFCGSKKDSDGGGTAAAAPAADPSGYQTVDVDDQLPF